MLFPRRRLTAAEDPSVTLVTAGPGWAHWGLVAVSLVLAGCLYVWLAGMMIPATNRNPVAQDQKNNMRLSLEVRETLTPDTSAGVGGAIREWLPHRSDGVVAPLWPWLAAWVARDGHRIDPTRFNDHTPADLAFFERGKWLNVWITGLFLAGLGVWLARRWTVLGTVNTLLLALLGAALPRAVAFQPEPVYFILFFLSWMVGMGLCARNPLGGYVVFGLLCGLAGLAKSSIEPLMLAWAGATGLRFLLSLWRPCEAWSAARHVIGLVMGASMYFLILAPRMIHSQEQWGRPFFSYPKVWMWMDDFPTGYSWMGAHPDARALDAVPAAEWPSFSTYRARHSWEDMGVRLRDGLWGEDGSVRTFLAPKGSGKNAGTKEKPWKRLLEPRGAYLGGLAAIAVAAVILGRWGGRPTPVPALLPVAPKWPATVCQSVFGLGVVTGLSLLYAWYVPIGRGDRFMLSLWMPLVVSLTAVAEASIRPLPWGARRWTYAGLHLVLLGGLCWRILVLMRAPFFDTKLL